MKLTKVHYKILGKIFEAEYKGEPPRQFSKPPKHLKTLEAAGLIEEIDVRWKYWPDLSFAKGWVLTHPGRLEYCDWASKQNLVENS